MDWVNILPTHYDPYVQDILNPSVSALEECTATVQWQNEVVAFTGIGYIIYALQEVLLSPVCGIVVLLPEDRKKKKSNNIHHNFFRKFMCFPSSHIPYECQCHPRAAD